MYLKESIVLYENIRPKHFNKIKDLDIGLIILPDSVSFPSVFVEKCLKEKIRVKANNKRLYNFLLELNIRN